ncbi:MAG: hypothetical protein ACRCZF_01210, partial [Gemmataceae bacterium]
ARRFWDHPGVVIVSHTLLLALFFAALHAYVAFRGIRWWWLLPTALLSAVSVPIVSANIYPQKDTIFTALLWLQVFWVLKAVGIDVRIVQNRSPWGSPSSPHSRSWRSWGVDIMV